MFFGTADKGMAALGAGPLYTNAVMGQAPSVQQREDVRKASTTILRQDSIKVELSDGTHTPCGEQESRPDSLHYARTDQPPYVKGVDDKMMTQTSLLHLPKANASHDLAYFLKTTGPNAPNRRPRKVDDHPRRALSASKNVLKWLKVGQRKPFASIEVAHLELNKQLNEDEMEFQDEGGLLLPPTIEQKVSSTGKKYLALKPNERAKKDIEGEERRAATTPTGGSVKLCEKDEDEMSKVEPVVETPPMNSPIMDSHISISFDDDTRYSSGLDAYYTQWPDSTPSPTRQTSVSLGAESEPAIRMICHSSSPVRPAASSPPTPESATLAAESYKTDLAEHPAKQSLRTFGSLSSRRSGAMSSSVTPAPRLALPQEEFPVKYRRAERDFEIKHPSPRRLGSHPVLLHRTPSMAASLGMRSFSDSPGPPPPKSPLRLCRDPRSLEGLISSSREACKATPKIAPSIKTVSEYASDMDPPPTVASVTTECTGPIKRPKSRERNPNKYPLCPMSRRDREERTKQRKIRDKPDFAIDSVVNATRLPTRRLRKAWPQIQIPDFKPAPLATRTSSSASSSASWKKVTQGTLSPMSTVPSQDEKSSGEGKTGYSPKSPTSSNGSPIPTGMALSPVMLVAEEVAVPKSRSTPKPTRLILRGEGSKYAPRPRSASMSCTVIKRRSKGSVTTTSRPSTPDVSKSRAKKDTTPPLPSPPPNRALPPTPPASGSEVIKKQKPTCKRPSPTDSNTKELPLPPSEPLSPPPLQLRHQHHPSSSFSKGLPHITTQDLRTATSSSSSNRAVARIDARLERLEALEKQNALLNAALMAVLRTNGALNTGPLVRGLGLGEALESDRSAPMGWENRVSRRNTATTAAGRHAASSSNGSASLELYLSTRREGS